MIERTFEPRVDAIITQTLEDAIDTLEEAVCEVSDECTKVIFVAPDGMQFVTGMFRVCEEGTDDEYVVVDLLHAAASA